MVWFNINKPRHGKSKNTALQSLVNSFSNWAGEVWRIENVCLSSVRLLLVCCSFCHITGNLPFLLGRSQIYVQKELNLESAVHVYATICFYCFSALKQQNKPHACWNIWLGSGISKCKAPLFPHWVSLYSCLCNPDHTSSWEYFTKISFLHENIRTPKFSYSLLHFYS